MKTNAAMPAVMFKTFEIGANAHSAPRYSAIFLKLMSRGTIGKTLERASVVNAISSSMPLIRAGNIPGPGEGAHGVANRVGAEQNRDGREKQSADEILVVHREGARDEPCMRSGRPQ